MDITSEPLIRSIPLKIGLIETPPYIYKNSMGDIDGFEYDIIKHIVDTNELNVEYIYLPIAERDMSYNELIDLLEDGTYDILLGNISQTYERSKRVIFSSPTGLDIGSFFYRKGETSGFNGVKINELGINLLKIIIFLIIISLLFSFAHYYNTPTRISFKESWWRATATIFGEPGFVLNPKMNEKLNTVSVFGLIIRLFIILVSVLTGIIITSYVTSTSVSSAIVDKPFTRIEDVYGKKIVVRSGQSEVDLLKSYENLTGMDLVYIDDTGGTFELLTRKMENDPTIDAFFMSLAEEEYRSKNGIYVRGAVVLEKGFTSLAINKKHLKLAQMINISISNMRNNRFIRELCERYFTNPTHVCVQ